jgi:hypothetical protein
MVCIPGEKQLGVRERLNYREDHPMQRLSRTAIAALVLAPAHADHGPLADEKQPSSSLGSPTKPDPTGPPGPSQLSGICTVIGSMNQDRDSFTLTQFHNHKALVAGGILCSYSGNIGCYLGELHTP